MKNKKFWVLLLCFILLCNAFISVYAISEIDDSDQPSASQSLSISFFPLENSSIGDSCVIRYGNIQILIDAGPGNLSNADSINTIASQMRMALEGDRDKIWEYVIITHGDADHITSLSTNEKLENDTGIIAKMKKEYNVTFDTLIDFDTVTEEGNHLIELDTEVYKRYSARRADSFNKYYSASKLCKGTAHDIDLSADCTLTILYNPYYDANKIGYPEGTSLEAKKNLASVCVLIKYKQHSFLFTGDLEEYDSNGSIETEDGYSRRIYGETYLLNNNKKYLENGVTFYKAAHHGSKTSNSSDFIDAITPQHIVIPTIAGTSEKKPSTEAGSGKRFPTQKVLSNFLKYTDNIYITSKAILDKDGKKVGVEDYYGQITITSDGEKIAVKTEKEHDGTGNPLPITKTEWFRDNRKDTGGRLSTYVFELPESAKGIGRCTLLKYRSIDILIDCGIYSENYAEINTMYFVDKIREKCADGKLDYLIVSNAMTISMSNTIGTYTDNNANNDGVFGLFDIENLIDFNQKTNLTQLSQNSWLNRYYIQRKELVESGTNHNQYDSLSNGVATYKIDDNLSLKILNSDTYKNFNNEGDYSLVTVVEFCGERLVFTGSLTNEEYVESNLAENYSGLLKNATFFLAGDSGSDNSNSEEFLSVLSPEYTVISTVAGISLNGSTYLEKTTADRLWIATDRKGDKRNIYLTSQYINGEKSHVCGDVTFTIEYYNGILTNKNINCAKSDILMTDSLWYNNQ